MINYCLPGSALSNVPEKDFALLFPLLPASISLFSLCFSPHCGPRAGREEGSLAQGEECAPFGSFFSGLTCLLLWYLLFLTSLCFWLLVTLLLYSDKIFLVASIIVADSYNFTNNYWCYLCIGPSPPQVSRLGWTPVASTAHLVVVGEVSFSGELHSAGRGHAYLLFSKCLWSAMLSAKHRNVFTFTHQRIVYFPCLLFLVLGSFLQRGFCFCGDFI